MKINQHRRVIVLLSLLLTLLSVAASAQQKKMAVSRKKVTPDPEQENRLPRELREIGWDQNIGQNIPLDLEFTDQDGNLIQLGELFQDRPVLLAPVYFECPMLCSLVLDGIVRGLKPLKFLPGQEFEVVAVSFDPDEDAELADLSRNTALARYGRSKGTDGWTFLTGEQDQIAPLMAALGMNYRFNEETDLWAHPGGVVLLSPDGMISRYFYGVDYAPKDLRLGLVEASENKVGSIVDQVVLFCYQYDPVIGKYSMVALNVVRLGGILTVLALAIFIVRMLRAEKRQRATAAT